MNALLRACRRNGSVLMAMWKTSLKVQLQYRVDFFLQIPMQAFWIVWALVPLVIVFELRPTLSGATRPEAILVLGAFIAMKAILEGLIQPNLVLLVEHIRQGTLDFVLLKPVDSQLLVSVQRTNAAKGVDLCFAGALSFWAITELDTIPSAVQLLSGLALFLAGVGLLYGLWFLIVSTAFWFVRIDNLSYLFGSIFDAARWPIGVFRGWTRILLTVVLPVLVMTSYPVLAALGRLSFRSALLAMLASIALVWLGRRVWFIALSRYTSASS